jgi:hypothetical protein
MRRGEYACAQRPAAPTAAQQSHHSRQAEILLDHQPKWLLIGALRRTCGCKRSEKQSLFRPAGRNFCPFP